MQNTNTESPKWESIVEVKWQTIRDGCALRGKRVENENPTQLYNKPFSLSL